MTFSVSINFRVTSSATWGCKYRQWDTTGVCFRRVARGKGEATAHEDGAMMIANDDPLLGAGNKLTTAKLTGSAVTPGAIIIFMDVIAIWPQNSEVKVQNELIVYNFDPTNFSCTGHTLINRGDEHGEVFGTVRSGRRTYISKHFKIVKIVGT